MSEQQKQPKAMTQEELDAAAKAADKALEQAVEPPAPIVEEPVVEPTPEPPAPEPEAVTSEIDKIKAQVAEKEARIAELTKRLRDEDGSRGGELTALRSQVEKLGNQAKELMEEIRELRHQKPAKPDTPPEPDEFREQYPDLANGVDKRTKPISEQAAKAEAAAKETQSEIQKLREEQRARDYNVFLGAVKQAVPKLDEINSDKEFLKWLGERIPGTTFTRQKGLDEASSALNSGAVIELFQQFEQMKTTRVEPTETPKGPGKPSKESQVAVPGSSSASPKKTGGVDKKRIEFLKNKIMSLGTSTREDRIEYERLIDQEALEEGTA